MLLSVASVHGAMNYASGTESLSADSSSANKKQGLVAFNGNVVFSDQHIQLQADKITIREQAPKPRHLTIQGVPLSLKQDSDDYTLNAAAQQLEYLPQQRQLTLKQNIKLTLLPKSNEPLTIKASQVDYQFADNDKKPINLHAVGSPASFELTELNGTVISASSDRIYFSSKTGKITMEQNVSFAYQGDQITAEKLIFDTQEKAWQVPAVKNKRFEIIKKPN